MRRSVCMEVSFMKMLKFNGLKKSVFVNNLAEIESLFCQLGAIQLKLC